MDHQGHGQSEGDRAYVVQMADYVTDFLDFVDLVTGLCLKFACRLLHTFEWPGADTAGPP